MRTLYNFIAIIIVLFVLALLSIFFINNYINTSVNSDYQIFEKQLVNSQSQIIKNELGSTFIRAENINDVYFTLGFAHSSDRIWQMELLKLKSQGRISELFGSNHKKYDLLVRSFDIVTKAKEQLKSMDQESKDMLSSYCNGINLYLNEYDSKLPMEFGLNNYQPKKWNTWEPIAIYLYLKLQNSENFTQEIFFNHLNINFGYNKANLFLKTLKNQNINEPFNSKFTYLNFNTNNIFSSILDQFVGKDKFELNVKRIQKDSVNKNYYIFSVVNSNFEIPTLFYECKINYNNINSISLSIPGVPVFQYLSNEKASLFLNSQNSKVVEFLDGNFDSNKDYYKSTTGRSSFTFITDTLRSRNSQPYVYYKKYAKSNSLIYNENMKDSIFYSLQWDIDVFKKDFVHSNAFLSNNFNSLNLNELEMFGKHTFLFQSSIQNSDNLDTNLNQESSISSKHFVSLLFISRSFDTQIDTILNSFTIESERDLEFVLIDYSSQFALSIIKAIEKNLSNKLSFLNKQEVALYYELKNFDAIFSHKKRQSFLFDKFIENFLYNSLEDDFDKKTIQYILSNKNLLEYTINGLLQSGAYFLDNKHSANQNEDLAYILLQSIKDVNREFRKDDNLKRTVNFNEIAYEYDTNKMQFSIKNVLLNGTFTSINNKFGNWGSNFRIITDTEKNVSYFISATGNSGDPVSPFFTNLHRLWLNGGFIKTYHNPSKEHKVFFEFNP